LREVLQWQKSKIKKALVKDIPKSDAVYIWKRLLQYMGDKELKVDNSTIVALEIIEKGLQVVELRDEIYCQLCKQLTFNPSEESTYKGWDLFCLCIDYFPPSKDLYQNILLFLHEQHKQNFDEDIPLYSKYCIRKLPKTINEGARGRFPNIEELDGLLGAPFRHTVFGVTLQEVMETQKEFAPDEELPLVLTRLAKKVIELNGHKTEGIFRVPGDSDQVVALKIKIENGVYEWDDILDAHVPGSLLKFWMRDLEEPIISSKIYNDAIETARDDNSKQSCKLVKKISKLNRKVVEYVIQFLREMSNFEEFTKMPVLNLSMVFAPNFLRCPSEDPQVIFDTQKHQQTFVRHLIENPNFKTNYTFALE